MEPILCCCWKQLLAASSNKTEPTSHLHLSAIPVLEQLNCRKCKLEARPSRKFKADPNWHSSQCKSHAVRSATAPLRWSARATLASLAEGPYVTTSQNLASRAHLLLPDLKFNPTRLQPSAQSSSVLLIITAMDVTKECFFKSHLNLD